MDNSAEPKIRPLPTEFYALACTYSDGNAKDPWYVGWCWATQGDRYLTKDFPEKPDYNPRCYRFVMPLHKEEGAYLLENSRELEELGAFLKDVVADLRRGHDSAQD